MGSDTTPPEVMGFETPTAWSITTGTLRLIAEQQLAVVPLRASQADLERHT